MSWLDERMAESEAVRDKIRLISEQAETVYENLWREVKEISDEARTKGFTIKRNGSPYQRIMRLFRDPQDQRSQNAEELGLALAPDKKTITATTPHTQFCFTLDTCDGGIVCLTIQGVKISVRDAAIRVVDRWLFPELPPKY